MTERFTDALGVPFDGYQLLLPPSVHDWDVGTRCKDPTLLRTFAALWDYCQLCGRAPSGMGPDRLHIHHLVPNWRRAHEHTCLMRLCSSPDPQFSCHDWAHAKFVARLPVLLWAKWRVERYESNETLNWARLALLYGKHLPRPQPDDRWLAVFARNRRIPAWVTGY